MPSKCSKQQLFIVWLMYSWQTVYKCSRFAKTTIWCNKASLSKLASSTRWLTPIAHWRLYFYTEGSAVDQKLRITIIALIQQTFCITLMHSIQLISKTQPFCLGDWIAGKKTASSYPAVTCSQKEGALHLGLVRYFLFRIGQTKMPLPVETVTVVKYNHYPILWKGHGGIPVYAHTPKAKSADGDDNFSKCKKNKH